MSRVSEHSEDFQDLDAIRQQVRGTRPPRHPAARGQSLAELALVLPLLLVLVFGILEISRLLETRHTMSALTREGANLASRGTSLERALTATEGSTLLSLGSGACVIVTELEVNGGGIEIPRQLPGDGCEEFSSRVEGAYNEAGLREGNTYYVVEIFVRYEPFTPFRHLELGVAIPGTLYDRSLF
ncbi:MAG: TadE/TadG family type IV pilus assembly protein [Thermoanaerobaculia bacterium]